MRRRSVVALTPAGRTLHELTLDEIVKRHSQLVGGLTRKQIETFVWTVHHLGKRISLMDKEIGEPKSDYRPARAARTPKKQEK